MNVESILAHFARGLATLIPVWSVAIIGADLLAVNQSAYALSKGTVQAKFSCYTELINFPTTSLDFVAWDPALPDGTLSTDGTVVQIGHIELTSSIKIKLHDGVVGLCSSSLAARNINAQSINGYGSFRGKGNDCLELPKSRSFNLSVGHEILEPLGLEPIVSCNVEIISPRAR